MINFVVIIYIRMRNSPPIPSLFIKYPNLNMNTYSSSVHPGTEKDSLNQYGNESARFMISYCQFSQYTTRNMSWTSDEFIPPFHRWPLILENLFAWVWDKFVSLEGKFNPFNKKNTSYVFLLNREMSEIKFTRLQIFFLCRIF